MKNYEIYPIVKAATGGDDAAAEHLANLLASGEIDPHKVVPLLVAAARQDEEEAEAADLMAEGQAAIMETQGSAEQEALIGAHIALGDGLDELHRQIAGAASDTDLDAHEVLATLHNMTGAAQYIARRLG